MIFSDCAFCPKPSGRISVFKEVQLAKQPPILTAFYPKPAGNSNVVADSQ